MTMVANENILDTSEYSKLNQFKSDIPGDEYSDSEIEDSTEENSENKDSIAGDLNKEIRDKFDQDNPINNPAGSTIVKTDKDNTEDLAPIDDYAYNSSYSDIDANPEKYSYNESDKNYDVVKEHNENIDEPVKHLNERKVLEEVKTNLNNTPDGQQDGLDLLIEGIANSVDNPDEIDDFDGYRPKAGDAKFFD